MRVITTFDTRAVPSLQLSYIVGNGGVWFVIVPDGLSSTWSQITKITNVLIPSMAYPVIIFLTVLYGKKMIIAI